MITFQAFSEKLRKAISEYYGKDYKVELIEIPKNNGVIFRGITIQNRDSNMFPTIYMEGMYQEYQAGKPLAEIMDNMIRIYENNKVEGGVDTKFFLDFSGLRERILYKLVNYEKNEELLLRVPHRRFMDMALVYYYSILNEGFTSATILIRNDMLGIWKTEEQILFELAQKNTPNILPPCIMDMEQIIQRAEERPEGEWEDACMYVLTNEQKLFGAVSILYPELLKDFAQRAGRNLYILPSSVHEVILVPEREGIQEEAFSRIVKEINATQVEPEEVLTDSVYYYNREKNKICVLWR